MNINRNSSQRQSQSTVTDGGGSSENFGSHWRGARKIARQPVSSSRVSHWKPRKSPQIVESERYRAQRQARPRIGASPTMSSNEKTTPAAHWKCRNSSLALNQHKVGSHQ